VKLNKLGDWRRTHYSSDITPKLDGQKVTIFGWVHSIRDLGGIKFILLADREGLIQVTLPLKKIEPEVARRAAEVKKQYVIGVKGIVKRSTKVERGVEIVPEELRILNYAQHPLSLDPTGRVPADIDVRLNARVMDLRRPEGKAIFKINHVLINSLRDFLIHEGFIEIQTPKIIATATEGGASLFPIVYFEREAFLAQSPQLYKEQLTSVFEKVFEIAPFFRAEESHTTRHISEFISGDIEQAFATKEDVMELLENMIAHSVREVTKKCDEEFKILKRQIKVPKLPFKRYTYDEILDVLRKHDVAVRWGEDIPTPALRTLGELYAEEYYFIVDWPTETKTFYIKPRDGKPEVSEGFDLMYSWVELASGGTRIHDKEQLIDRMEKQGLNPASFDYHIKTFESGMPPHAGWGLGVNRLLMVIVGKENIRECILFPRDRFRLTP